MKGAGVDKKNTVQKTQPRVYTITKNGKQYFVSGKLRIEIVEHFAEKGKTLGHLIENTIVRAAAQQVS